ncbi:MAG: integrase arm-type DNA-binding domain-containing protein [Chromatiales bacterium]
MAIHKLSPRKVETAEPGKHEDGAGLRLVVSPAGAKKWVLRYTIAGKRREMGLGSLPDVGLAEARDTASRYRKQAKAGIDPIEQRQAEKTKQLAEDRKGITFDECARRYLLNKTAEFSNAKHAAQWSSTLETYASPTIGRLSVDDVTLPHIVNILEPIWLTKTETATRVRGRIESVLAWATVSGYRSGDNPARWKGNLDAVLAKPTKLKKVQHHKAIQWADINDFVQALRMRNGLAAKALEFLILTATRSGEVRGAVWDEIDLDAKTWTIPAERMKADREHTVPLCDDALALLESLPRSEENNLVFPSVRGRMLSDVGLAKPLKAISPDATVHGFRSTFRDWCAESTNYPNEVAEMALAHSIGNAVEKAYRRGDLLAKRTRLMDDWCKYINTPAKSGDVINIRSKEVG